MVSVALASTNVEGKINEHASTNLVLNANSDQKTRVIRSFPNTEKATNRNVTFEYEAELKNGDYIYIIELEDAPVAANQNMAQYLGNRQAGQQRNQAQIKSYVAKLEQQQQVLITNIAKQTNSHKVVAQYHYALNGIAVRMSQEDAAKVAKLAGVKSISRDKIYKKDTDRGPELVGAPALWQGQVPSLLANQGEGVVIGVIDSGINTDHPSFAEISGDGYTHTNPLGSGNYLGDCVSDADLCNAKLIGVYSYPDITDAYADTDVFPPNLPQNGEDYDGHGSHVASTAAGNVLLDVAETFPESGAEESDGVTTEFTFSRISGVAPRANIVSYQICYPGSESDGDTYNSCPGSAIIKGIDSAIADQVDVINYSISGGGNPWNSSTERAFLNANNIGIYVATSAGNSGPNPSSSEKNAPWYTSVAASEHGRQNAFVKELNNFTGGNSTPPVTSGQSNSGSIRAPIVYAGDFANPNDPNNDSAQCLEPFPANTFSGQIVVCDRGEIARVDKAINVDAGGAGGFVLANVDGGDTFLANDQYVIPGIHIKAADGNILKQWLASGANHMATITSSTRNQAIDQDRVDIIASFSSRGPNATNSTLTPTLAAPGVDIYAAYADQQFGHDGHEPAAGDFSYLQGTSMASPHVAGAAALLSSIHPTWTPDQIRSALSMTANSSMRANDETTDADYFDMGAGRIRVDLAAQVGLVLNETYTNYLNANPSSGGEPKALNIPSITDDECLGICTWSRTFTATQDGSWTVNSQAFDPDLNITVSPTSFDILAGQTQTVTVTIDSLATTKTEYVFGQLTLSASNSPDLNLPISILSSLGDVPTEVNFSASRLNDMYVIEDLETFSLAEFYATPFSLTKATVVTGDIAEDTDNSDYLDDLDDGVTVTAVEVPANAKRIIAKTVASTAPDLDLFLLYDANNDGFLSSSEELASSLSSNQFEEVMVNFPEAGTYYVVVQSFSGSNAATDSYEMHYAVVTDQNDGNLQVDAPSSVTENTPFSIDLLYDLAEAEEGDVFYGAVGLSNNETNPDKLGMIDVNLTLSTFDTKIDGTPTRLEPNETASLKVLVNGNTTADTRSYRIEVPLPANTSFSQFTTENDGQMIGNSLFWVVEKLPGDTTTTELDFDIQLLPEREPGPIEVSLLSELLNRSYTSVLEPAPFTKLQLEGAPSIAVQGNANNTFVMQETETLTIPVTFTDPNDDEITVTWTQTSGPTATVTQTASGADIEAPFVDTDSVMNFTIQAVDAFDNATTADISISVTNNEAPSITTITAPTSGTGGTQINISFSATDPENDALTYSIGGVSGSSRNLTLPTTGTSVSYELRVSDGINVTIDRVTISLTQTARPNNNSGGGGGGSMGILLLTIAGLMSVMRRYRYANAVE